MKSGFVSLIGRPNVGKSSLLNKVLNYKLSIVTATPQTTRDKIKGIFNDKDLQIVFLDTPGIHKPKQKLGESLNNSSYSSFEESNLIMFMQPADEKIGPGDKLIIEKLPKDKSVALVTKIDLSSPDLVKDRAEELKLLGFKEVIGVSIEMKASINHLISFIKEKLPEGEPFYNKEDISDVSLRFMAREIIRETIIENTREEVPHSVGVEITEFKEKDITDISSTIFIERNSQKGIIIGKDGKMIKKIGTISRMKMEKAFGFRINLKLKVKVNKKWTESEELIKKMGY